VKTRQELLDALATANRIWQSRQEIHEETLPSGITPEERLELLVDKAHDDYELTRAFMVADTLKWVLDDLDADNENIVFEMLNQFTPERTGDKV
jgi:hypothetical protein